MAELLYRTPPPHRTHHDPSFDLDSATFVFDLSIAIGQYRNRIAAYDKTASKYMVGPGHKRERETLHAALVELEALAHENRSDCPDGVAATFSNAMGNAVYDQFVSVHCHNCNSEYDPNDVEKTEWVVDNGFRSTGWRLVCPNNHVLFASIGSVTDYT